MDEPTKRGVESRSTQLKRLTMVIWAGAIMQKQPVNAEKVKRLYVPDRPTNQMNNQGMDKAGCSRVATTKH